jgi:hypothetical protein
VILVNFSHPLTGEQVAQVEALTGLRVDEVRDRPAAFDHKAPFEAQVRGLIDQVGLEAEVWQTAALVVNLPGYAPGAGVLLAELHGRMGHFATVVRLRPVEGSVPTRYEVAEVINLQGVRDRARKERQRR